MRNDCSPSHLEPIIEQSREHDANTTANKSHAGAHSLIEDIQSLNIKDSDEDPNKTNQTVMAEAQINVTEAKSNFPKNNATESFITANNVSPQV
jgi:hypothetical protein